MGQSNQIFLSNRTEQLYEELKASLFASANPFVKRIVIVPSAAMKSWLMLRMARDPELGVSAGLQIGFVEPMIQHLMNILGKPQKERHGSSPACFPTTLELSFAIEALITEAVKGPPPEGSVRDPEWSPLINYLGVTGQRQEALSRKVQRRISRLSCFLVEQFNKYGIYGSRMLASWKKEKKGGWQRLLWEGLETVFDRWGYVSRQVETFELKDDLQPDSVQVHLFGLSYLPPVYYRFFNKLSFRIPVNYYLLSPCGKFWGDVLSDREGYRLTDFLKMKESNASEREGLEELLRDKNSLLANFGKLGRETAEQLENIHAHVEGTYLLPASVVSNQAYAELLTGDELFEDSGDGLTLLQAVQADVTLLRNPSSSEMISFDGYDRSVQVHAAPKLAREVEIVYDLIMGIIDRHKEDESPITPSDVFVMAPDISVYAPFVSAVFQSDESKLDIHLMDHQTPSRHSLVQGFARLLDLSKGRWEASSLLQLFEHPSFRNKHQLNAEDLRLVRRWVEEAGICWGKDEEHRKEIFKNEYDAHDGVEGHWSGTWEHGLGRLLEGLVMTREASSGDAGLVFAPLEGVEGSKAELLGTVIQLVRKLQADLRIFSDGTMKTLDEWSASLRKLLEDYFALRDADGSVDGAQVLLAAIDSIGRASSRLNAARYPFESVSQRLKDQLSSKSESGKVANVHAVRFSSLQPMRALPARVVILIGMNDGEFPRNVPEVQLNLLKEHPESDYCPDQVDLDRYLFLEALLSARDYFLMTYVSQDPGMPLVKSPSLLVGELLDYISVAYRLTSGASLHESCHFRHYLRPYDKHYFEENSPFRSYSPMNYHASEAYYHASGNLNRPFITIQPLPETPPTGAAEDRTIDLRELASFAKNPLKEFFKGLGITITGRRRYSFDEEEELFLSNLNRSKVSLEGLEQDTASLLGHAEAAGWIPQGSFAPVAKKSLIKEIGSSREQLASSGFDDDGFYSIEFRDKFLQPKLAGKVWQVPPLAIDSPLMGKVKFVGRIERVSQSGAVHYGDKGKKYEKWPLLAVFAAAVKAYGLPFSKKFLFCKNGKIDNCEWNDGEDPVAYLQNYLEYYFKARTTPSPLTPGVVKLLLGSQEGTIRDHFKSLMDDDFRVEYDPHLKWLWRNCSSEADLDGPSDSWKVLAELLFDKCESGGKKTGSREDR